MSVKHELHEIEMKIANEMTMNTMYLVDGGPKWQKSQCAMQNGQMNTSERHQYGISMAFTK